MKRILMLTILLLMSVTTYAECEKLSKITVPGMAGYGYFYDAVVQIGEHYISERLFVVISLLQRESDWIRNVYSDLKNAVNEPVELSFRIKNIPSSGKFKEIYAQQFLASIEVIHLTTHHKNMIS